MFSKLKMLEVTMLQVGQLKSNCYLVFDSETRETLIIDPGDDAGYLLNKISDDDLVPKMILATHGHFDHLMAVNEVKLGFNIPFLMAEEDLFLLERMRDSAKYFVNTDPGPAPAVDNYLKQDDIIKIASFEFVTIKTPGHTPGGLSFHQKQEKVVFVGDLVFKDGLFGRTDFSYSDPNILKQSVQKIIQLPEETTVYSGHGKETSIKNIKLFLN